METPLNKKLNEYYAKNQNNPTKDTLSATFKDLGETNDYGSIAHALVNFQYDQKWILKVLEILFNNKVKVNFQAKNTGYSYIHLALYGYTDKNGKDISYSTEFITSLINLGKNFGLNVNMQDKDGDSIIHTALASEVYTGKIVPLIEALGSNFNLQIKDNDGRDLKTALDYYIKMAVSDKNESWTKRLKAERDEILALFEVQDLAGLEQQLKALFDKTTLDSLVNNLDKIRTLEARIRKAIEARDKKDKKKTNLDGYFQEYHNIALKIINDIIQKNLKTPNKSDINKLDILETFFDFDMESLGKIKDAYNLKLNELKNAINVATSIELIDIALGLISEFLISTDEENEYIDKNSTNLRTLKAELEKLISNITSSLSIRNKLMDFIKQYYMPLNDGDNSPSETNYSSLNKDELKALLEKIDKENTELKRKILEFLKEKMTDIFRPLRELSSDGTISNEEIRQTTDEAFKSVFEDNQDDGTPRKKKKK